MKNIKKIGVIFSALVITIAIIFYYKSYNKLPEMDNKKSIDTVIESSKKASKDDDVLPVKASKKPTDAVLKDTKKSTKQVSRNIKNLTIKQRISAVDALFEGSEVEQAAKYMKQDDYNGLKKFFKNNPDILVDTRSPFTGSTLLQMASGREKQNAVKALLESGADPNLENLERSQSWSSFTSAIFTKDTILLKLYIKHGADVNKVSELKSTFARTPLMLACGGELSVVKFMIKQGADPHFFYKPYDSALNSAIISADIDITNYLIYEQKVDFKQPYYYDRTITAGLRNMCYPIGSRKHQEKMKLVAFLKENGLDYYAEPIPKRFYKLFDEDYLSKY